MLAGCYLLLFFQVIDLLAAMKSVIACFNEGNYPGAEAELKKAIVLNPKDYQAFVQRGKVKFQAGEKKGACSDWSKAGELGDFKIYDNMKKKCN